MRGAVSPDITRSEAVDDAGLGIGRNRLARLGPDGAAP